VVPRTCLLEKGGLLAKKSPVDSVQKITGVTRKAFGEKNSRKVQPPIGFRRSKKKTEEKLGQGKRDKKGGGGTGL